MASQMQQQNKSNLSRRDFLARGGTAALVIGGLQVFAACQTTGRKCCRDKFSDTKNQLPLSAQEYDILRLAALAPSGHNAQPWTVTIQERGKWLLGLAPERLLPQVDPENREAMLSLGAFLENMALAAELNNMRMHYRVVAPTAKAQTIAEIRLSRSRDEESGKSKNRENRAPLFANPPRLRQAMEQRRTLRKDFSDKPINKRELEAMLPDNKRTEERWLFFAPDSPQARYLNQATLAANRKQASRQGAQRELSQWIHWDRDQAAQACTGLTPATMEITGFAGWYVRNFYDRSSVLSQGFRQKTISMVQEQVTHHGGWLILTSKDSSVASLLRTGRIFERVLLQLRQKAIAAHPMSQILEEKPWQREVAGNLGLKEPVQFALRLGYVSDYPDPVSLRLPVRRFAQS